MYRQRSDFYRHFTPSCSGDRFYPNYQRYNNNGVESVRVSGMIDRYAEIQASADSVDIYTILGLAANGQPELLNQKSGYYVDISDLPSDIHDVYSKVNIARDYFDSLPISEKQKYNNSFDRYLAEISQFVPKEVNGNEPEQITE